MFERLRKEGQATPLENRPELPFFLEPFLEAFRILSKKRVLSSELLEPIPLSEIQTYIQLFGIPGTISEFVKVIETLDEFLISQLSLEISNGRRRHQNNP